MSIEKNNNNNNKFTMVVLMALPVVLGIMFIISKNIKDEAILVSQESLIIPDVDDIESADDGKAKIYRDEQTEMIIKKNTDARNVASDKDFFAIDSDFGKDEKKQEQQLDMETRQVLEQYREAEQNKDTRISQQRSTNSKSQTNASLINQTNSSNNQYLNQPEDTRTVIAVPDERPQRRSSMGIYTANRASAESSTDKKMDQSQKYLRAVLEEDKVIQNGSNVIFVLSEEGNINGTNHKRGSILYGRATQGREFFEINIYQLKSANDGNIYHADLIVYDENYNRGIRSEGFLNEVSKDEGVDAASKTIDDATQGFSSIKTLDIATKSLSRTVSRTSRSRPITIPLRKGYKVYLQPKPIEK